MSKAWCSVPADALPFWGLFACGVCCACRLCIACCCVESSSRVVAQHNATQHSTTQRCCCVLWYVGVLHISASLSTTGQGSPESPSLPTTFCPLASNQSVIPSSVLCRCQGLCPLQKPRDVEVVGPGAAFLGLACVASSHAHGLCMMHTAKPLCVLLPRGALCCHGLACWGVCHGCETLFAWVCACWR
jgi:hypothetical protein